MTPERRAEIEAQIEAIARAHEPKPKPKLVTVDGVRVVEATRAQEATRWVDPTGATALALYTQAEYESSRLRAADPFSLGHWGLSDV